MEERHQKAVIYARIRTETKEKADKIIADQIEKCKAYALSKNIKVAAYFSDQQFGEFDHTLDDFDNLYVYVENHKVDYLIVQSIDRINRSPLVYERIEDELKEYGTSLVAVEAKPTIKNLLDLE